MPDPADEPPASAGPRPDDPAATAGPGCAWPEMLDEPRRPPRPPAELHRWATRCAASSSACTAARRPPTSWPPPPTSSSGWPTGSTRSRAGRSTRASPSRRWPGGDPHAFFDHSPMIGRANPLAPPIELRWSTATSSGRATFGSAYEGPPGCVHGGYVAAAFDEVLGSTQSLGGQPGHDRPPTVHYRSPTPLHTELRFEGGSTGVEGRKTFTDGTLHAGDRLCAEAEGLFIAIDFAEARRAAPQAGRGLRPRRRRPSREPLSGGQPAPLISGRRAAGAAWRARRTARRGPGRGTGRARCRARPSSSAPWPSRPNRAATAARSASDSRRVRGASGRGGRRGRRRAPTRRSAGSGGARRVVLVGVGPAALVDEVEKSKRSPMPRLSRPWARAVKPRQAELGHAPVDDCRPRLAARCSRRPDTIARSTAPPTTSGLDLESPSTVRADAAAVGRSVIEQVPDDAAGRGSGRAAVR